MRKQVVFAAITAVAAIGLSDLATAADADAEAASPGAASSEGSLVEITVTATRREESQQRVPVAVSALTSDELSNSGVETILNLTQAVPSYFGGKSGGAFQPTIRGVGSFGTSPVDESSVATYVDGIYQVNPMVNFFEFADISRVEVLRGPQGTLFGRNATGGLINIITPDPSFTTSGHVTTGVYDIDGATNAVGGLFSAYATGGLTDRIAADLAVRISGTQGYFKDVAADKTVGEAEDALIRSKIMYESGSGKDKVILTLNYRPYEDDTATAFRPLGNQTASRNLPGAILPIGTYDVSLTQEPLYKASRASASLVAQHDFESFRLISTTDEQVDTWKSLADSDDTNLAVSGYTGRTHSRSTQEELRLASTGDSRLQWGGGAYYLHQFFDGTIDIYANSLSNITSQITPKAHTDAAAGFANASYAITDALKLDVSGRFNNETREETQVINGNFNWQTAATFNKWTDTASLRYAITPTINTYVTYNTGFKSGVFNTYTTQRNPVSPEDVKMVEAGIKMEIARMARLNLAIFNQTDRNLQVTSRSPGSPVVQLLNAPEARERGIEAELQADITSQFSLQAHASYLDATYTDFPNAPAYVNNASNNGGNTLTIVNAAGMQMQRAPKFTAGLTGNYSSHFSTGVLDLSATVYHSSRVYFDFDESYSQDPYTKLAANVGWTFPDDKWKLNFYGTNLTNARIYTQINPQALSTYVGTEEPRKVGIGVSYKF
jgi:iron complex outermembrane receptor protein